MLYNNQTHRHNEGKIDTDRKVGDGQHIGRRELYELQRLDRPLRIRRRPADGHRRCQHHLCELMYQPAENDNDIVVEVESQSCVSKNHMHVSRRYRMTLNLPANRGHTCGNPGFCYTYDFPPLLLQASRKTLEPCDDNADGIMMSANLFKLRLVGGLVGHVPIKSATSTTFACFPGRFVERKYLSQQEGDLKAPRSRVHRVFPIARIPEDLQRVALS